MSTSPRICLCAENASLRMGGEAILPFHYFRLLLRRGLDVHLIVHERCRRELLELFPAHAARLHFVADQPVQKLLFHFGALLPRRVAEATCGLATQLLTQRAQVRVLRRLIVANSLVHQPIPVSPRFPSGLHSVGAPVLIGPLNGGMEYPPAFRKGEGLLTRTSVSLGRAFSNLANRLIPGKREAAMVLVANQRTRQALPSGVRGQIVTLAENAVDVSLWHTSAEDLRERAADQEGVRFVFVGRLVDWKALDVVIDALLHVHGAELHIVGDGPMRDTWEAHARSRGVADRTHFLGWRSQAMCAQLLHRATALVLPSVYESGGAVVLEALASRCPVIATAWGGPAEYLDERCGVLVQPTSRVDLVAGFASAMRMLAGDPGARKRMGEAGRQKVLAEYDWDVKIEQILNMYGIVMAAPERSH